MSMIDVKLIRWYLKMTQSELASALGITQDKVSRLEIDPDLKMDEDLILKFTDLMYSDNAPNIKIMRFIDEFAVIGSKYSSMANRAIKLTNEYPHLIKRGCEYTTAKCKIEG